MRSNAVAEKAMPPIDRRVRRTQTALAQALIALSLEKGYATVSIRDITARAGIGYATFFRHYPDKESLLTAVLELFVGELTGLLETVSANNPAASGELIFRYVGEHHELCRVLLGSRSGGELVRQLYSAGLRPLLAEQPQQPGSVAPPELVAHHSVSATVALIEWWFENGMALSPTHMGEIYASLIIRPLQQLGYNP